MGDNIKFDEDDIDSTGELSTAEYRGGEIRATTAEIYASMTKSIILDPTNPVDRGVLRVYNVNPDSPFSGIPYDASRQTSLSKRKLKDKEIVAIYHQAIGTTALEKMEGKIVARFGTSRNYIRFDELINMRKPDQFFDELGMTEKSTAPGVAMIGMGRGPIGYAAPVMYKDNPLKKRSFISELDKFKATLREFPTERDAYFPISGRTKYAMNLGELEGRTGFGPSEIEEFMDLGGYVEYWHTRNQGLIPTINSIKAAPKLKFWDCSSFSCPMTSGYRKGKITVKGVKTTGISAQGFFYVEHMPDGEWIWLADGFSVNGLEVEIEGLERDEVLEKIIYGMKFDEGDPFVRNRGSNNPEKDVTVDEKGKVVVNMRRKTESRITHTPIMKVSDKKRRQGANIFIGEIDPGTKIRENILGLRAYRS